MREKELEKLKDYKYGFSTDIENFKAPKGLNEDVIRFISKIKTIGCEKHSKKGCNGRSAKCITHDLWDELEVYINDFFRKKNIGDLKLMKD